MIQRLFWRLSHFAFDLNRRSGALSLLLLSRASSVASYTEASLFGIALHQEGRAEEDSLHFSPPGAARRGEEGESEKLTQKISISQTTYSIFAALDPPSRPL